MVKELITEGYSVKDSCKALGVSRSRYYSFQKQGKITITERMSDVVVLEKIKFNIFNNLEIKLINSGKVVLKRERVC